MSKYPEFPGFKVSGTSRDAAEEIAGQSGRLRGLVIKALKKRGPMTADECAAFLGESVLAIRPRFSELVTMGLIADAGARRQNASGRSATVWKRK